MTKIFSNVKFQIIFFYVFLFLACFMTGLIGSNVDVDIWSRLIQGFNVFNSHDVMRSDIVSYTPTHVWYDHEWLSSFLIFVILKYFGATGLIFLKTFLAFLSISFMDLFIVIKRKVFNYDYKYLYITIYLLLAIHMNLIVKLRCQQFTYVFYPLFVILLEYVRNNPKSKIVYLIPITMLVWLNCHGASMYGIGVLGLYITGEILNRKPVKHLFTALIFSILVYFINPWGIDFVRFMISAISTDRSFISEWQSPFIFPLNLVIIYLINLSIAIFVYIYSNIKNKNNFKSFDRTKFLILSATLILALKYIKHNFTFFITAFMFLYEDFKIFFDDIVSLFMRIFKRIIPVNWILFVFYIAGFSYIFNNYPVDLYYQNSLSEFPVRPMQFISDNNIRGKIFASYFHCGFIAYKTYPDIKIYADGRLEQVYDNNLLKSQLAFLFQKGLNQKDVTEKYPPDIFLLETYWPAVKYLKENKDYKEIYNDGYYAIFVPEKNAKASYDYDYKSKYYNKKQFFKSNYFN